MHERQDKKTERQINAVLHHQAEELKGIKFPNAADLDDTIASAEALLKELGYRMPHNGIASGAEETQKKQVTVPSWDALCAEAEAAVGHGRELEALFTEEGLRQNDAAVQRLNAEYNALHRLDKIDVAISAVAGILGGAMDILLVGIPQKTENGLKAGPLANYIREQFHKKYPPEEMEKLANSEESKFPYDAQDNRNTSEYVEGLSSYYHRLLSLGHDPLLGFVVGVLDIMLGRMTTIDKNGRIVSQVMENYADRKETDLFEAIAKQIAHLKSDVTTSMGLPAPMMSLFNLLQFGSIGEEEQTIAEIVQGMYYEGYDFIHFCSMSIPVMVVEVVVRLGWAIKRIKEGHRIRDSIPFSLNREKHPKLATMLFIGHTAATAINTGKICFTKNPMAINYPQWLAFAKYVFGQLKWGILTKPVWRDSYVRDRLGDALQATHREVARELERFSEDYVFIFS